VSSRDGVLVVDVGGTTEALVLTAFTQIVGNLGAATIVHADGRRADFGGIVAERVEVVCPDSARG
jgi:hypothetical protein